MYMVQQHYSQLLQREKLMSQIEIIRAIKCLNQTVKATEKVIVQLIKKKVNLDEIQFGFVLWRSITDVITLVNQLQEKYLSKKNKLLFLIFVNIEKTFEKVSHSLI